MFSSFRLLSARFSSTYQTALVRHPYIVQGVQVSIMMGVGDVIAQTALERKSLRELDLRRTGQFVGLGFFLVGPALRYWYGKLDTMVKIEKPLKKTVVKMALDQLCFAPTFIVIFTSALSAIQGLNGEQIVKRLRRDYFSILKTNYIIWPAAQLINFGLVPLNYQVIFVQFVAIVWNTYLSAKLGSKKSAE